MLEYEKWIKFEITEWLKTADFALHKNDVKSSAAHLGQFPRN